MDLKQEIKEAKKELREKEVEEREAAVAERERALKNFKNHLSQVLPQYINGNCDELEVDVMITKSCHGLHIDVVDRRKYHELNSKPTLPKKQQISNSNTFTNSEDAPLLSQGCSNISELKLRGQLSKETDGV